MRQARGHALDGPWGGHGLRGTTPSLPPQGSRLAESAGVGRTIVRPEPRLSTGPLRWRGAEVTNLTIGAAALRRRGSKSCQRPVNCPFRRSKKLRSPSTASSLFKTWGTSSRSRSTADRSLAARAPRAVASVPERPAAPVRRSCARSLPLSSAAARPVPPPAPVRFDMPRRRQTRRP